MLPDPLYEQHVVGAGPLMHFCRCHALISWPSIEGKGIRRFPLIVIKIIPQCVNLYILLFCYDKIP